MPHLQAVVPTVGVKTVMDKSLMVIVSNGDLDNKLTSSCTEWVQVQQNTVSHKMPLSHMY